MCENWLHNVRWMAEKTKVMEKGLGTKFGVKYDFVNVVMLKLKEIIRVGNNHFEEFPRL